MNILEYLEQNTPGGLADAENIAVSVIMKVSRSYDTAKYMTYLEDLKNQVFLEWMQFEVDDSYCLHEVTNYASGKARNTIQNFLSMYWFPLRIPEKEYKTNGKQRFLMDFEYSDLMSHKDTNEVINEELFIKWIPLFSKFDLKTSLKWTYWLISEGFSVTQTGIIKKRTRQNIRYDIERIKQKVID